MKLLKLIKSYFPSNLPVGMTQFEQFANDIVMLAGPLADENSMKYVIASIILNLGPNTSKISKQYFVRSMRKAAANQIAGQVFTNIKEAQKAEELAKQQLEKQDVEATAPVLEAVTSNDQKAQ